MRKPHVILGLAVLLAAVSPHLAQARSKEGHHWAQVLRAASDAASGHTARALLTLNTIRRGRDTPALATASALCYLLRNDVPRAHRELQIALKLGGSYVEGHYWTAVTATRAGKLALARTALHRAFTLGGERPHFLMLQALLAKKSGQPAVARAALGKLARKRCELLAPSLYPDPMAGLTQTVLYILRLYPRKSAPVATAGNLMMMTRRYRQATHYYQRARKLMGQHPGLLLRLARLSLADGDAPTALRRLDRALALATNNPELRAAKAEVLLIMGRPAAARAQLELAVNANPGVALNLSRLADLLWSAGGYERAERLYRYALRRQSNLASARYGLGRALDRKGRYVDAEQAYRAAASINPANERYHLALALLYDKLKQPRKAGVWRQQARKARALGVQMRRLTNRASATGGLARQACTLARARASRAATIMTQRIQHAPALKAFVLAHLAALAGKGQPRAIATVLAGLNPARLLHTTTIPPTVLSVQGRITSGAPVTIKRYLSYLSPALFQ